MVTPEYIENLVKENLEIEFISVKGDGHHFEMTIVSKLFSGKNLLQQHQIVYKAIGDDMKEKIHALSIKSLTPDQWNKN